VQVGVIGSGRIGGNAATLLAGAGHAVKLSFARDPRSLVARPAQIGNAASLGTPAEAVAFGEVVIFSVPWSVIPNALNQAGGLTGKIVVDTTNQFRSGPMPAEGEAAGRPGPERVVQWICGDDTEAKTIVAALIDDAGFAPVDLGGTAGCAVMEAPRRPGAVYGEEYRPADAQAVVEAVRQGRPIPPTPRYD
jgi:hypothetical protein